MILCYAQAMRPNATSRRSHSDPAFELARRAWHILNARPMDPMGPDIILGAYVSYPMPDLPIFNLHQSMTNLCLIGCICCHSAAVAMTSTGGLCVIADQTTAKVERID